MASHALARAAPTGRNAVSLFQTQAEGAAVDHLSLTHTGKSILPGAPAT